MNSTDPKLLTKASIVFLSKDQDFAKNLQSGLRRDNYARVDVETSGLMKLNGQARNLVDRHDIILFDVPSKADGELEAARELLIDRDPGAVAIAFAADDVTLSEVQRIRESGFDEVLPRTSTPAALRSTIEETYTRKASLVAASGDLTTFVSVTRARGGLGATTLAVNLARQLVRKAGKKNKHTSVRVAILDLDIQFGDANVLLDLEDEGGVSEFAAQEKAGIIPNLVAHQSGLDIFCAPKEMIPLDALSPEKITLLLESMRGRYDFVFIDLPRALVDWVSPILELTSQLIVVTDLSVQSIRQARRLRDVFREDNIALPIEYVANRTSMPRIRNSVVSDAEKVLETRIGHWIPDMPKEIRKAADLGCPVVEYAPRAKVSKSISNLATSIVEKSQKRSQKNRGQLNVQ